AAGVEHALASPLHYRARDPGGHVARARLRAQRLPVGHEGARPDAHRPHARARRDPAGVHGHGAERSQSGRTRVDALGAEFSRLSRRGLRVRDGHRHRQRGRRMGSADESRRDDTRGRMIALAALLLVTTFPSSSKTSWMRPESFNLIIGMERDATIKTLTDRGWNV